MSKYNFPTSEVAESIAIALSRSSGKPIRKDQVVVEPMADAGCYRITVYESSAILDKVIKYVDDPSPTTLAEPCLVGLGTDRNPHFMDLRQHGQLIGKTKSGKSSLLHVMLAHATRCPDCVIWVGGVWKLNQLVGPWLEPYLDSGLRPPIDWVAHGQQDVCEMIAATLRIASHRFNLRQSARVHVPHVIMILDEVTYVVDDRMVRVSINDNDKPMCADDLLADNTKGVADAGLSTWLATQRDTQDNFGQKGGTTIAQMGFTFVFKIRDSGSLGRTLEGWSLQLPTRSGEAWYDPGVTDESGAVFKIRVPYIQSPDPSKPRLHDGCTISDVSLARQHIDHTLDLGSANAAGEAYANRHQLVTEEYLTYLTTKQEPKKSSGNGSNGGSNGSFGTEWGGNPDNIMEAPPTPEELFEAEARWNHMLATHGGDVNAVESAMSTSAAVAENDLSVHRTRKDKVLAFVRASDSPKNRVEIITRLREDGDPVTNPNTVTNICRDYVLANQFAKTEDDRYYAV